MAKKQERSFFEGNPQDLYPNVLEEFIEKMKEKNWDRGQDDEELLEYALHPAQYEDYKSGKAKENFLVDLAKRKTPKVSAQSTAVPVSTSPAVPAQPKSMLIDVDGVQYRVKVFYDNQAAAREADQVDVKEVPSAPAPNIDPATIKSITAPLEGKFFLTKDSGEKPVKVGDSVKEGDTVAYIESMKVINAVAADKSGTVLEIVAQHGEDIEEDDVIFRIS